MKYVTRKRKRSFLAALTLILAGCLTADANLPLAIGFLAAAWISLPKR